MTFDKLYSLLFEGLKFSELPENIDQFYGFWVSPGGDISLVVKKFDHRGEAKKLIANNPFLLDKFANTYGLMGLKKEEFWEKYNAFWIGGFQDFLYDTLGYMRIAKGGPTFYASTSRQPSVKQKSTLNDLGMLYEMETSLSIEED